MSYQSKFQNKDLDLLFDGILSLENKEECYRFFEDLCTINELQDLGQRIRVALMLDDHVSYAHITEKTHASTATISRVNRALSYGADGYKLILKRIKK
ncbi:MAG: hypothetical protein C4537_01365 [Acholeplasma sp.]|jgi:TrpR-related protein YerC/YecD|nr:MAG: hypothetical protein C4537_01365 [Acholeplasma sp.]